MPSPFRRHLPSFLGVALFSAAVNVLMLTGPLFMLQVYDRVLASASTATLMVLFGIVVFLFAMMGLLDHIRSRVLARIGASVQADLDARVFAITLSQAEHPRLRDQPATGLRDLASVQAALASPGMGAVFDLPWTPLYLALLFLFHPWMGWFAIAGSVVVFALALLNRQFTRQPQAEAARSTAEAEARTETTRKAIETVRGLGMTQAMTRRWQDARAEALRTSMVAADVGGAYAITTKTFRMLLQSAILALAALLVLRGELSPGAMIAGSILLGRALAPIEQITGHWPLLQRASAGWKSLSTLLNAAPALPSPTELPRPEAKLEVRGLAIGAPGETTALVQGLSFEAQAGDAIAVIGPSASGKSSLARALVGIWPAARGEIRLNGAELRHYDRDALGQYIGYLSQDVMLFAGTVKQNIARFQEDAEDAQVIAAAQRAAAHDLILGLPDAYDTTVTEGGGKLSGGQRQRIGLARAFFGDPVMLVLDEPNSSLDETGIQALNRAIASARAAGKIVLVMSHRPSALAECNKVMIIEAGQMRAFGPRDEVLKQFVRPVPAPVAERA